jgi:hypothetical protein
LNKNYDSILQKSSGLSEQQRRYLYDQNSKTIGFPITFNVLFGFGIGSFVQRDTVGGIVGLIGDGVGLILMLSSIGSFKENGYSLSSSDYNSTSDYQTALDDARKKSDDATTKAIGLIVTGSVFVGVARVFEIIRPQIFANSYNRTLKDALNYYGMSYNITPSFDMDGNGKVTAAVSFKY